MKPSYRALEAQNKELEQYVAMLSDHNTWLREQMKWNHTQATTRCSIIQTLIELVDQLRHRLEETESGLLPVHEPFLALDFYAQHNLN